jgi:hypothetical protein
LIVKKFDEAKQLYLCRVKKQEEAEIKELKAQSEIEVSSEEISEYIFVLIRALGESNQSTLKIKVCINDNIEKLKLLFPK